MLYEVRQISPSTGLTTSTLILDNRNYKKLDWKREEDQLQESSVGIGDDGISID